MFNALRKRGRNLPNLLSFRGFNIYFWSDEGNEPIHVHVQKGKHTSASTKIWLLEDGNCLVANNKSQLTRRQLRIMEDFIKRNFKLICKAWKNYFQVDELKFYK